METYINFTITNVLLIEKTNEPYTYWVLFDRLSDISIYGPCPVDNKFRAAVMACREPYKDHYGIKMRIDFDRQAFDEFMDNVRNTGRVDGVLTINEVNVSQTIYKFEITRVNPRAGFTINRVVEIRKAKMGNGDRKFLIFFERDEDGEPKIDIYSEDHDTISAINKKLKKSSSTKRYYLVVDAYGKTTEPRCKDRFFAVTGYINTNKDIVMTSYEEVNYREETKMKAAGYCANDALVTSALFYRLNPECSIKKVIYNNPATIIFWSDGTKTVVKCMEDEVYDPEKGFMAAVTKKVFGDKYGWVLRHHVKPAVENEKKVDALMDSIAGVLHRKRMAQDSAMAIRDQMLVSGATHWELETFDRFVRKYIVDKEEK